MSKKFGGFGGGGFNMQSMMQQAKQLQEKVAAAQEELEETELTATAGGGMVTVRINGKKELLGISIKPEAVDPDDVEMLEDMIVAAINDGYKQAEELHEKLMGPLTGGMGGLF